MHSLRFAARTLRKDPGFTAAVILSMAIGIGATTTVLCWRSGILDRPVPGTKHQHEFAVLVSNQGGGNISLPDARDFDQLRDVFAGVVASQISPASLLVDDHARWIYGQVVTANYFEVLGVQPVLGRTFLPDEDRKPGGNPVIVISERLWERVFARDPEVINRTIDLNRSSFTVIGVAPDNFNGTMTGLLSDYWAPISMNAVVTTQSQQFLDARNARGFHNIIRLRRGVGLETARAAVAALDQNLAREYPRTNRSVHHRLVPYAEAPFGAQQVMGPVLGLLLVVSLGVLLIVTVNIANLLLARASARQKEIAVRLAAGASRWRLVSQLLIESLLLAFLGGAAGVFLSIWMVDSMALFFPATAMPVSLVMGLDPSILGWTLLLTAATGIAFGLVPAIRASRPDVYETLKEGGRSSADGASHHRIRNALVVAEIALALVLLAGAGLCIKGTQRAKRIDVGFSPERVLIGGLQIGMNGYDQARGIEFYGRLQQRLATTPGVESAALASWFPLGLSGCKGLDAFVEGYDRPEGENPTYEYATISPGYFSVMRIPLMAGRDFAETDTADTQPVAIVNEFFARRFWSGLDPIGRRFRSGGTWWTVVGVSRDGKYNRLSEPSQPFFYLPYRQRVPDLDLNICVRTLGSPEAFVPTLVDQVRSLDPAVELWGVMPLTGHVEGAYFTQRIATSLLALLGFVALALAAMGVYAVTAYSVNQRTQEFGLRVALGATTGHLLREVVGRGLLLAVVGLTAGLIVSFPVTSRMTGFLHGVSPFDAGILASVSAVLLLSTLLACLHPAWRAARADPMVALRNE